jgi:hypothetical protein
MSPKGPARKTLLSMLRLPFQGVRAKSLCAQEILTRAAERVLPKRWQAEISAFWARRAGRQAERDGEFGPHGVRSIILYDRFGKTFVKEKLAKYPFTGFLR